MHCLKSDYSGFRFLLLLWKKISKAKNKTFYSDSILLFVYLKSNIFSVIALVLKFNNIYMYFFIFVKIKYNKGMSQYKTSAKKCILLCFTYLTKYVIFMAKYFFLSIGGQDTA